jgi:hypothetical protein
MNEEDANVKTSWIWTSVLAVALMMVAHPAPVAARDALFQTSASNAGADSGVASGLSSNPALLPPEPPVRFRERDLSGPRIGITMAAGDGSVERQLQRRGIGRVISQFGWHFEHQIVPLGGGPQLVTELIPLFGGVEYGKLIPSVTLALGVRFPSGLEFGMGPSLTLTSAGGGGNAGLVVAVGKTIDYGGVSIPLNLAVSTNPKGTRTTLVAGYAIRRASR